MDSPGSSEGARSLEPRPIAVLRNRRGVETDVHWCRLLEVDGLQEDLHEVGGPPQSG